MTTHTVFVIAAWGFGSLAVLLLAGGFVLGPAAETAGAYFYRRESDRLAADEQQRKLMAALNEAAAASAEPGEEPAPVEPEPKQRQGLGERVAGLWRRPMAALKARNEAILKEREARRG